MCPAARRRFALLIVYKILQIDFFITLLVRVAWTYIGIFKEITDQLGENTLLLCEICSNNQLQ